MPARVRALALLPWCLLASPTFAQPGESAHDELVARLAAGDYSRRGADTCLRCHDEEQDAAAPAHRCRTPPLPTAIGGDEDCAATPFATPTVFATAHGHPAIAGSPFAEGPQRPPAGLQCEACHGPVGEHGGRRLAEGERRAPMVNFGAGANAGADLRNQLCLACHADYGRTRWHGGVHEQADVGCADCHRIHSADDPVRLRSGQTGTCLTCHQGVYADMAKRSSHPMREGQLVCADCHDPHTAEAGLARMPVGNEACTECHADLRGPFLWEHPPAAEDCGICHLPHGANQPALLVRRPPQLCQGCHSSVGHRSLPQLAERQPDDFGAEFLFASGCVNCHAQVHGSNHPSGNLLRR